MKLIALLACLGFMLAVPTVAGAEFTMSGPPSIDIFDCGGGGGP